MDIWLITDDYSGMLRKEGIDCDPEKVLLGSIRVRGETPRATPPDDCSYYPYVIRYVDRRKAGKTHDEVIAEFNRLGIYH